MHRYARTLAAALALCAAISQAKAANETLADCVDLSAGRQTVRSGSQYLAVKDGDAYYRLGFGTDNCAALTMTTKVQIVTDGTANRLCPQKSHVQAYRDSCRVTKVELIDAEEFMRYRRLSR